MGMLSYIFFFLMDIGLWKSLLLVAGLALVIFEMFHPGFGAPGITGSILLTLSIILICKNLMQALILIILIIVFLGIVLAAVIKSAKNGRLSRILILDESLDKKSGFSATLVLDELDGKEGFALTPLRPSGIAVFNGNKFDVVTEGEFIPASKYIKVIKIDGRRIVVREIISYNNIAR